MSKKRALEATDLAGELLMAARRKAGKGKARQRRRGNPLPEAESIRRSSSRLESDLNDFETEVEASRTVVSAPSPGEIRAAGDQLRKIRNLSAQQAATKAGIKSLESGLKTAKSLKRGVKI